MKAFSRTISLLLLGALLLGLCACTGGAAPEETAAPAPERLPPVRISELMPSNKACLALDDGSFPDWVELENTGAQRVELDGCELRCKGKSMSLDGLSLEPGGLALVPLRGLKLPKEGETLSLVSPLGTDIDSLRFDAAPTDRSLVRDGEGLLVCRWPTPGFENSKAGYEARQQTLTGAELVISEAMVYNDRLLPQADYRSYDWVELKNVSDRELDLSGYTLSDKGSDRARGRLPAQTLAPGECLVLLCGADPAVSSLPTLDFSLAADTEQLFLSRPDGSLCDYVSLHDIPLGMSCGRMDGEGGFFYFAEPSPGADNTDGCRRVSDKPAPDGPDGVFEGVDGVTLTLSGSGPIYLTRDGSVPTVESERYTEPIRFTQTGVLRAICAEEGCIPSETLDLSYILNEGHTIPVASVISDPDGLFSIREGIYSNPTEDWERPASVALYADERGFEAIACGIKIHGATSRLNMLKKSFKLNFRSRYDGDLSCDLFENGVTEFSSILLRAAQESSISTEMRDVVMHELSMQCSPSLSTQAHRYCALYLNGEYRGVYALREAHSEEHFARHYGYDPEQVKMWKGAWPSGSPAGELFAYMLANDMRDDAVYARVCEHLDVESVITWALIQTYCSNTDTASPNMRFYYSAEDDRLHFALVDLDLGFFSYAEADLPLKTGYRYSDMIALLLKNESFRALYLRRMSEYLHGPLSDENFLATVEAIAAEIRAEMPRDYQRWRHNPVFWQQEIDTYLVGSTRNLAGRRDWLLAASAKHVFQMTDEEWEALFGDIPEEVAPIPEKKE